jgi:Sec7-like guanine-nucleotide exchange factor
MFLYLVLFSMIILNADSFISFIEGSFNT